MDEVEFRVYHSKIVDLCKTMEDRLACYYLNFQKVSGIDKIELLDKRDRMPLSKLIASYENFSEKDFPGDFKKRFKEANKIRNYYVHELNCSAAIRPYGVKEKYVKQIIESHAFLELLDADFEEFYLNKNKEKENEQIKSAS